MRRHVWITGLAAIALSLATASIRADIADSHMQYLTFSRAIALPGVTLGAGTYIFELADPGGTHDIVRVLSRDGKHVVFTAYTNVVNRPRNVPPTAFVSFREVVPNTPVPIAVWWNEPDSGREFVYRQ